MTGFLFNQSVKVLVIYGSAYLLGLWVIKRGAKVNYTRKIFHLVVFSLPLLLAAYVPFERSAMLALTSATVFLACALTMSKPFRSRSSFLATAFASIDRPEDRPFTLPWLTTQFMATYAVMVAMLVWLDRYDKAPLMWIPVLVVGIGDALAEPVGVRFGRHRYSARGLFTDRAYTRSLEGSACVLASAVVAVLLVREHLTAAQLALALFVIPAVMVLAEALSPHSWDAPFLYLAGGLSIIAVLQY